VASTLNDLIVEGKLSTKEAVKLINPSLNNVLAVFDLVERLIFKFKPKAIYTFNPRFANTRPIYLAARKHKIRMLTYEGASTNDKYELFEGSIFDGEARARPIMDHWIKGGPERENIGRSYFTDLKNQASGRGRGLENELKEFIDDGKVNVVFFPSSIHETYALGDLYNHRLFASQFSALEYLIKLCTSNAGYNLILRIHPAVGNKSREEQDFWLRFRENKSIKTIHFNSSISSYDLLEAADRIVVYHSTIAVEAAYEGKPAMALGSPWYIDLGCVYKPLSIMDIMKFIEQGTMPVSNIENKNAILYGYYFKTFGREYKHLTGPKGGI
jgi:hypothetical protein